MERDEIKFEQKRWSKRQERQAHNSNFDEQSDNHLPFDLSIEEELHVESENNHEIYTPDMSEGEMPGPIISPPSKVIQDKDEYRLAENRKRMSSFRKEGASMHEYLNESGDEESAYESSGGVEGSGWKRSSKGNPFLAEILSMLEDSQSKDWSYVEEQEEPEEENPFEEHSILTDIVSSMDAQNGFKNPYHAPHTGITESDEVIFSEEFPLKEEGSLQEEKMADDELSKEDSSLISEVFSMFDESSSWVDELEETHEEDSSSSADLSSFSEESPESLPEEEWHEESSFESSSCLLELEESSSSVEDFSEDESVDLSEEIVVKVPVLLSCVTVDVDLMETLDVPADICEIIDIELSLQSMETKVVSPSCYAFISGVIKAEVQYNDGTSIQILTLPIPWNKVVPVEWKHQPLLPCSNKKEYFFGADVAQEQNVHMEFYQTFTDSIESEGQSVRFVSHQEAISNGEIHIQGTAQIVINLLQQQYVIL